MIKLDYQRHELEPLPGPKSTATPAPTYGPGHRYPVWLGYVTVYVAVIYALGYLGMAVVYASGWVARPQAAQDAGVIAAIVACFCIAWCGWLIVIGMSMIMDAPSPHGRLFFWCAVQLLLTLLLATACACEGYFAAPDAALGTEEVVVIMLEVGISSAAYAVFLLLYAGLSEVSGYRQKKLQLDPGQADGGPGMQAPGATLK